MKEAYLTIDDSPTKDFKQKIDFLAKNKIPAIIFCIGRLIEKHPKEVEYAIKKGFIIGNHSYSHPRFSRINLEQAYEEILKTDKLIEQTYKNTRTKRPIKIFRFPYGDKGGDPINLVIIGRFKFLKNPFAKNKKRALQEILSNLEYTQPSFQNIKYPYYKEFNLDSDKDVFWTYDCEEYWLSLESVLKKIEMHNPRQGGDLSNPHSEDIILIHDHEKTTKEFPIIIEALIKKGIKFKLPKF